MKERAILFSETKLIFWSEGGAGIPPPTPPSRAARADFRKVCKIALAILHEMVSSLVVNVLHNF
ncbi:MAG: hypothetical protein A2817_02140 [Candidatus Yanofskybacteria bacterium RIFCSPHIGHO2_01_FULL_39_8b]|uniref:Uncharacterized protein n=1 Tax=Candidatus Yanofskybacteria bacterium RIFCSPHIGHO2_01_FULL_39_8b TaxID=1802659 RepID=A0A1F8EHJ1_9BACT|nr:MAG: hypothetical protein A2817_02140 [Candidatus Yanofskybacteria bacterium RIFCSPHIGHO2_01_FULL_39_8b]